MSTETTQRGEYVALTKCWYCGGDNEVLIHRQLRSIKGMHDKVVNKTPCTNCEQHMKRGIILIGVIEAKSGGDVENPYRSGAFVVLTESAVARLIQPKALADAVIKHRSAFIEHQALLDIGAIKQDG